jgi:hypothetical protein
MTCQTGCPTGSPQAYLHALQVSGVFQEHYKKEIAGELRARRRNPIDQGPSPLRMARLLIEEALESFCGNSN